MTDHSPSESDPVPAAQGDPAPQSGGGAWAAGVSDGPAGWPGAIHADYTERSAEPVQPLAPDPKQATAQAPTSTQPPIPAPTAETTRAETAPRVQEVEARPITAAERRGPTIEIPPAPKVEPAPPAPASASAPPPQASAPGVSPALAPTPPPQASPIGAQPAGVGADRPPRRRWAVIGHLAYLIPIPPLLPIAGIVVTTLIWVWKRRRDALVEDQGRESLNFQITYLGINTLLAVSCFLSVLIPVVWIAGAVLCVVAAVRAGDGEKYRYPYIFRLIA